MKNRFLYLLIAAALLTSCEKAVIDEPAGDDAATVTETKRFTFTCKGDFGEPLFREADGLTRGYLSENGEGMTDLWVFDYMNGECVQTLHQQPTDADFGRPTLSLAYGSHHVYFVASRGTTPTLDEQAHTIVWDVPRDTYWKDYAVEVVKTSNGNRAVTLDRVATRLRITVTDEVPGGTASLVITPKTWYYGLDYTSGATAGSETDRAKTISVPSSYAGTTGQLTVNIFGLSGTSEWTTDVVVTARNGNGTTIGEAEINGAPFKAGRSTEYSGALFATTGVTTISLDSDWTDVFQDIW